MPAEAERHSSMDLDDEEERSACLAAQSKALWLDYLEPGSSLDIFDRLGSCECSAGPEGLGSHIPHRQQGAASPWTWACAAIHRPAVVHLMLIPALELNMAMVCGLLLPAGEGLSASVDAMHERVTADPRTAPFFKNVDHDKLVGHIVSPAV